MQRSARIPLALLALSFFVCATPVAHAALVNINTASAELLETLPGIGPTKAAAIIAYRGAYGPFQTTADIQEVSGIGPATFAKLEALITVGVVAPAPKAPVTTVQPVAAPVRSQGVQAVDRPAEHDEASSAVSSPPNVSTHQDQAVEAPAALAEPAAAGAAVPTRSGVWRSGWVVGLLVILAFAGAAFMIL